jgi:hormone-sensitive lipase
VCLFHRYITCHRDSILFRLDHNSHELDAYVTTLGQLRACLYYLHKLVAFCGGNSTRSSRLFPDEQDGMSAEDKLVAEQMMGEVEMICQESFYGRCLGFQVRAMCPY